MLRRIRRLPSPALVIAALALVLAIGGGTAALALTHNERKAVKKIARNIANKKITQRAPGLSVDHANTANHANTAGSATASNVYFARVSGAASPTLLSGSPGVTVNPNRPFAGAALVNFPVNVTNCAATATVAFDAGANQGVRHSFGTFGLSSGNTAGFVTYEGTTQQNFAFNVVVVC